MDIVNKTLNYIKAITAETISNAKSGHTGSALGASSIMLALFHDHLVYDVSGTSFPSRDRLVVSAGHTSALYYTLLHLAGYDLSMEDLKQFRKYASKTPGHPEYRHVKGVETTTGPLGQGIANAVGMAIAEEKMRALFPDLISNYTYVFSGDGCLMEGVACEAVSLAGTLKLSKLILLYDDNNITIDGARTLANRENTEKKFQAMGWNTIVVKNGNDYHACTEAIAKAKTSDKPTIIIFKTIIGIGTKYEGTCKVHACPLSAEDLAEFKQKLGVSESFYAPSDVYTFMHEATEKNNKIIKEWNKKYAKTPNAIENFFTKFPYDFDRALNVLRKTPSIAGRDATNLVLSDLSEDNYFFGGTADLGPSTKAVVNQSGAFSLESETSKLGRNIHFGIREHAMGSIANGIALYCSFLNSFDSTFTSFTNYMLPAIRMRALMNLPVLSIFTHDSIDIGEDGPTHQPIEQIPQLRLIPGLSVFRPGTHAEVVAAFKHFISARKPTAILATKNKIHDFKQSTIAKSERGGYVLLDTAANPDIEIFATGKEVSLAVDVAKALGGEAVRVVSMPCISEFERQPESYKSKALLRSPKLRIAIEATNDNVWYKYIGENGLFFGVFDYQFSGNGDEVYEKAGFSADAIVRKIKKALSKI